MPNRYSVDGRPLFDPASPSTQTILTRYARLASSIAMLESSDSLHARLARLPVITDDNMGQEWEPNVVLPWRQ